MSENLERLRPRNVSAKRSLALQEFALRLEALEWFGLSGVHCYARFTNALRVFWHSRAKYLTPSTNTAVTALSLLPVPDRLLELRVVDFSVAPSGVEAIVPEVIRHERQVARLVVKPRPGRMSERVDAFELDLGDPAGRLEPFVHGDPRAGRQEVAGTLFWWDVLERFDQGGGEVDPSGLTPLTGYYLEGGAAEVDVLPPEGGHLAHPQSGVRAEQHYI